MQLDLSAQGWTAGVNAFLAFCFLLIPQLKQKYDAQPIEYQTSIRGITAIGLALLFVGGSCVGLWNNLACTKADILSFAGNVVIASVLGFQASGGVLHIKSTAQAFKAQRAGANYSYSDAAFTAEIGYRLSDEDVKRIALEVEMRQAKQTIGATIRGAG